MDVFGAVSLTLVLLAALYGVAVLWTEGVLRLLRPREDGLRLVLHIHGAPSDAEARVRYALAIAKRRCIPLVVEEKDTDEDTKRIVEILLRNEAVERR